MMLFLLITISSCDSMQRTSDISSQVINTPILAPIPTSEPTPIPEPLDGAEPLDVVKMLKLLTNATEYEEKMEMKEKYYIDTYQSYNNEHLHKIHYVVFGDKFELNRIHYGLTPNQVLKMDSDARLIEFTNINEGYERNDVLQRITYYLQYEQLDGAMLILPKESYYLVGISHGADSPFVKMAIIQDLSIDDVTKIMMGGYENPQLPPELFFSKPQSVQINGLEVYHIDLIKETKRYGKTIVASYNIDRISAVAFNANMDESAFEPGLTTEVFDLNRFMDPSAELRKFSFMRKDYPMDEYLEFTLENIQIFIKNKLTGESILLPMSARQIQNINQFIKLYDLEQLFILEPLDAENNPQTQKYSLKALFGLESDYWSIMTQNTYFDLAMLTISCSQETGQLTEIHIQPKYSPEKAEQKQELSLSDFDIGPLHACMKQEEFLEAIEKEGTDAKIIEEIKTTIRKLYFGTFKYNGIEIYNHPLAECFPNFKYQGSEQNYKTPRNIGIGSTKQDVMNAYNAPDIGLMASDQWEYLLDKPYWSEADNYNSAIHLGDSMKFIFKDDQVISIEANVFISGS